MKEMDAEAGNGNEWCCEGRNGKGNSLKVESRLLEMAPWAAFQEERNEVEKKTMKCE